VCDGKPAFLVQQNAFVIPGKDAESLVPVLHWDVVRLGDAVVFEKRQRAFNLEDLHLEKDRTRASVQDVHMAWLFQKRPHRESSLLMLPPLLLP
jgi:hypothetical protein